MLRFIIVGLSLAYLTNQIAGECANKNPKCPQFAVKEGVEKYCERPWPQRNCKKMCGVCVSESDDAADAPDAWGASVEVVDASGAWGTGAVVDPCQDKDPKCPTYPSKQKESVEQYCKRGWPKRNCEKLCGVCVSHTDDATPTDATPTDASPPEAVDASGAWGTGAVADPCQNKDPKCPTYPSKKKESVEQYCKRGWPKRNCEKLCGVCVSQTDVPAPETAAPETTAPETAAPETAAPETAAPETAAPATEAPVTEAPSAECPDKFKKIPNHSACLPKSPNAKSVVWSEADKQSIVDKHNSLRSAVDPPASNMMKLSWDDELAMIAQKWADACEVRKGLSHDGNAERAIPDYGYSVGQNAASTIDYNLSINMWWNEVNDYQFGKGYYEQTATIGHYTQMAWAGTYKVGCGAATCTGLHAGQFLTCNYGPAGNMLPFDGPYKSGDSGSDCKTNSNGLCDCGDKKCNSGKLLPGTCECDCSIQNRTPSFMTSDCQLKCDGTSDHYYCKWNNDCSKSWITHMCPHLCGTCPAA